jgi:hypothetical protein
VHLLPHSFRGKAIDEAGERLVRSREYGRAAALLIPEGAGHFRSARSTSQDLPRWSVEALFAAMHWRELVEATDRTRTPRISSVQQLAELLIPRELVEPLPFSAGELEEMLVDKRITGQALSSRDSAYTGSAALGLALVEDRSALGMKAVGLASELVRIAESSKTTPGLSARELLLVGLSTVTDPVEVALGAAHLTLDMRWLQEFKRELTERSRYSEIDLIYQVRDTLEKGLSEEYPSIRRLLATVDASDNVRKDVRLRFTLERRNWIYPVGLKYLRGPDPEMRDALRYTLADCTAELGEDAMVEILNAAMQRKFRETRPEPFARALREDPLKALLLPLEMVDRLGRREALIAEVRRRRPISSNFRDVAESYSRLDKAVSAVFSRFG